MRLPTLASAALGCLLCLGAAPEARAQSAAGTASGMVTHRVDPAMPPGVTGEARSSCSVDFQVGTEGAPTSVTVKDCEEPFRTAAQEAAEQWRFVPNVLGGKAYPYKYTARLDFRHTTSEGSLKHQLSAGVDASPSSGIKVLNRAMPIIPDDWQQRLAREGLTEVFWRVRIQVGPEGTPTSAEVLEAPDFLRDQLEQSALFWTFEPVVVEGDKQPFSYLWEHRWVPL